jgi:lipoprotein-anchoring transpeptidase ErfK/SrfK
MRRRTHTMLVRSLTLVLALGMAASRLALAAPPPRLAADAADRSPVARLQEADLLRAPDALQPGEFEWQPGWDAPRAGPVIVMVNLELQRAYVFRDGERIGTATVSSGKPGHETPTGVFAILQKQKLHHSNRYEDPRTGRAAPMPWMQRLSWDGVALHAGHVRAKPASHGCVRLPPAFAQQLYGITKTGDTVVVARDGSIASLAAAGVDDTLALLLESADSMHEIARKFVTEGETGRTGGAPSRAAAYSP